MDEISAQNNRYVWMNIRIILIYQLTYILNCSIYPHFDSHGLSGGYVQVNVTQHFSWLSFLGTLKYARGGPITAAKLYEGSRAFVGISLDGDPGFVWNRTIHGRFDSSWAHAHSSGPFSLHPRSKVMIRAILPGMMWTGMRKLTQDTRTNKAPGI